MNFSLLLSYNFHYTHIFFLSFFTNLYKYINFTYNFFTIQKNNCFNKKNAAIPTIN